jgi:choline dehydrogenase
VSDHDHFDYVVIGAGSAGCAVAHRLSEAEDSRVLLLEAGGWDTRAEIHAVTVPAAVALWTADWHDELDWGYETQAEPHLGGRRIPIARGKVVGGCGAVNALMWVRGSRLDYDRWAAQGATGWSFDEVLPYFVRAENYVGPFSAGRGRGGPIGVHEHRNPTPVACAFVHAARELGYAGDQDYNGPTQTGFGFLYQSTRTSAGERCSPATGYLHPIVHRPNLTVAVQARATRLVLTGDRVTGVEYVAGGTLRSVSVGTETVLCAGAFESPKLLMLSGIGPAARLREHGIDCHQDLPEVGENLADHLFVPVCYQSRQEHPVAELVSEAGLFTHSTDRGDGPPDLQLTFGTAKFLPPDAPDELRAGPGFTFGPVLIQPVSRGTVTLANADPGTPAVVRANYLAADADADVLVRGIELSRQFAATRAFDEFRGDELAPGPDVVGHGGLREFVAANATTLWHPVGTCRMGADDRAVVDPELRVRGVAGLRVADASVMPSIVAGNTNAPCVMIGEKAADLIAGRRTAQLQGGLA